MSATANKARWLTREEAQALNIDLWGVMEDLSLRYPAQPDETFPTLAAAVQYAAMQLADWPENDRISVVTLRIRVDACGEATPYVKDDAIQLHAYSALAEWFEEEE